AHPVELHRNRARVVPLDRGSAAARRPDVEAGGRVPGPPDGLALPYALVGRRPGRRLLVDLALDLDLVVHLEGEHSAGDRLQRRALDAAVHDSGERDVAVLDDDADGRVDERGIALEEPVAVDPAVELDAQPVVEAGDR